MGRRTNEELWKARKAPNRKGDGTVFEVVRNGQKSYRAVRVITVRKGEKPVQISGTALTPDEAIQRREQNVLKRLSEIAGTTAAAQILRRSEIAPTASGLTPDSPFGDLLHEWLKWKKRQTLPSKAITPAVYKQYETHVRKHLAPSELGIDSDHHVSPIQAALSSLVAFAIGGLLPLLAVIGPWTAYRIQATIGSVVFALILTGYVGAKIGGAKSGRGIIRNLVVSLLTMGITYAIGHLVGTNL